MEITPKPYWLRKRLPSDSEYEKIRTLLKESCLHTVCQEAKCPNQWECFTEHIATFLIMGSQCTRDCGFCAVKHGFRLPMPDKNEPERVAKAAYDMKLDYIVITSVTRDDLEDGGASCFAETIFQIKKTLPHAKVEVLIPDFLGNKESLRIVLAGKPDVLNHNIETVKRLYSEVRPEASYERSLNIFRQAKEEYHDIPLKSGIMLGLGEADQEIKETLIDIFNAGCSLVTIGQYLQPSKPHIKVKKFVLPEKFAYWKKEALAIGFSEAASGAFVRSSYHAKELYEKTVA